MELSVESCGFDYITNLGDYIGHEATNISQATQYLGLSSKTFPGRLNGTVVVTGFPRTFDQEKLNEICLHVLEHFSGNSFQGVIQRVFLRQQTIDPHDPRLRTTDAISGAGAGAESESEMDHESNRDWTRSQSRSQTYPRKRRAASNGPEHRIRQQVKSELDPAEFGTKPNVSDSMTTPNRTPNVKQRSASAVLRVLRNGVAWCNVFRLCRRQCLQQEQDLTDAYTQFEYQLVISYGFPNLRLALENRVRQKIGARPLSALKVLVALELPADTFAVDVGGAAIRWSIAVSDQLALRAIVDSKSKTAVAATAAATATKGGDPPEDTPMYWPATIFADGISAKDTIKNTRYVTHGPSMPIISDSRIMRIDIPLQALAHTAIKQFRYRATSHPAIFGVYFTLGTSAARASIYCCFNLDTITKLGTLSPSEYARAHGKAEATYLNEDMFKVTEATFQSFMDYEVQKIVDSKMIEKYIFAGGLPRKAVSEYADLAMMLAFLFASCNTTESLMVDSGAVDGTINTARTNRTIEFKVATTHAVVINIDMFEKLRRICEDRGFSRTIHGEYSTDGTFSFSSSTL